MKSKSLTRNALITSVISLLLCISMLVGTTFAWFTDTVVSQVNSIEVGVLDVELWHSDKDNSGYVDNTTKLFTDLGRWEPGAMVYENLKVENDGTLALKYMLVLKADSGSDVVNMLKVAVVKEGFNGGRAEAQAMWADKAAAQAQGVTFFDSLASFSLEGVLEGDATSETYGVVIYWEPSDEDNIFNQADKEGTLKVDLGVALYATQEVYESDSFGDDYDEGLVIPDKIGNTQINNGSVIVNIPAEAFDPDAGVTRPKISEPVVQRIPAESSTDTVKYKVSFDIEVDGLQAGNAVPATVIYTLSNQIPGDSESVEVYHNGVKVEGAVLDMANRTVTFTTASFSPFEVIVDTGYTMIPANTSNEDAVNMLKNAAAGAKIDGNNMVIDLGTADQNKWALSLTKNVSFANMTLKATGKGQVMIIQGKNQTVRMTNVTFDNTNYSGQSLVLSLNGATSQIFENCTFKGKAYFQGSNATFINCSFNKNNNMDSSATNFTFSGCKFTNSSAITINAKVTNLLIEGCTFSGNVGRLYTGMTQPTNVKVINNTYKSAKIITPDSGVDYEGWKAAGAWIEEGNTKV